MAQEIVTWCDVHLERGEREKGERRLVALLSRKFKLVDVCDACMAERFGPAIALLDAHGRTETAGPKPVAATAPQNQAESNGPLSCPVEGCTDGRMYKARSGVREHVHNRHNDDLANVEGRAGVTVDGRNVEFYCEVDGCPAGFATLRGRGAHHRYQHPEVAG